MSCLRAFSALASLMAPPMSGMLSPLSVSSEGTTTAAAAMSSTKISSRIHLALPPFFFFFSFLAFLPFLPVSGAGSGWGWGCGTRMVGSDWGWAAGAGPGTMRVVFSSAGWAAGRGCGCEERVFTRTRGAAAAAGCAAGWAGRAGWAPLCRFCNARFMTAAERKRASGLCAQAHSTRFARSREAFTGAGSASPRRRRFSASVRAFWSSISCWLGTKGRQSLFSRRYSTMPSE